MIKEVIVVEGRDDITAVKAALDAEVISTNGFGYNRKFIETLKNINKMQGIIIFTDPDYMGEKIRRDLTKHVPNAKHAFLPQKEGIKNGDIGIENAKAQDIIRAIEKCRPLEKERKIEFTKEELYSHGLIGRKDSKERREKLGEALGIGYSNSKQLLNRLNNFGVSPREFKEALERIDN